MSIEIARVNRVAITEEHPQNVDRQFALRYDLEPGDEQGVLAIKHLVSESLLREIAAALQMAVERLDQS
jgi:hypothetical protein